MEKKAKQIGGLLSVDLFSKSKKRFQETKQYQFEKPKDEVSPSTKIIPFFFEGTTAAQFLLKVSLNKSDFFFLRPCHFKLRVSFFVWFRARHSAF